VPRLALFRPLPKFTPRESARAQNGRRARQERRRERGVIGRK
jgi:hypothetical protein